MSELPSHTLPRYTEDSREDALFHYTSADGLIGILQNNEIWSTAYYCTNDALELSAGKGVLTPEFNRASEKMIDENDPLVEVFRNRGVDILGYADGFEQTIISHAFHKLCVYITCFCRPIGEEDFLHGLLSQWRGYGVDGGYALQFSRKKLSAAIEHANRSQDLTYQLQNVCYTGENPLKSEVLGHADRYLQEHRKFLENLGKPLDKLFNERSWPNHIGSLLGGPLEGLLDYLVHTKNQHFGEERECRLSLIETLSPGVGLPTYHFNRGGLIVPYKKTPRDTFKVLDCLEWIVIGPNSRMGARFRSVTQMVRTAGLSVKVRASHIPFART